MFHNMKVGSVWKYEHILGREKTIFGLIVAIHKKSLFFLRFPVGCSSPECDPPIIKLSRSFIDEQERFWRWSKL